jgi:hypothetical protein
VVFVIALEQSRRHTRTFMQVLRVFHVLLAWVGDMPTQFVAASVPGLQVNAWSPGRGCAYYASSLDFMYKKNKR